MVRRHELTDEQWQALQPLSSVSGAKGRPRVDDRRVINGMCQHNDVVFAETFLRSEYLEARAQIEQVSERFSTVQALALDEGESLDLTAEAATRAGSTVLG